VPAGVQKEGEVTEANKNPGSFPPGP
jgi:hypothetical protein